MSQQNAFLKECQFTVINRELYLRAEEEKILVQFDGIYLRQEQDKVTAAYVALWMLNHVT